MNPPSLTRLGTRERILAYLEENRAATVVALSRIWGLTRADIRYHFNQLILEGLVEVEKIPPEHSASNTGEECQKAVKGQPSGRQPRGRPVVTYHLTARSTPDNFSTLSSALLDTLLDHLPETEREVALRGLAASLAVRMGKTPTPSSGSASSSFNASIRFNQAVDTLNRHAYRARWEASPAGPRFLLRSCPYATVGADHRSELCRMDCHLLEILTRIPLRQVATIAAGPGMAVMCVFLPR